MWIEQLFQSRATNAIRLTARFAEERHKVLASNIANVDTPDYRAKRLDADAFRAALGEALGAAKAADRDTLELRGGRQVSTDETGHLHVSPATEPAENVLFHDGTNARLESQVTDMQENALHYRLALNLLRGRFEGLMTAIRGRTS